MPHAARIHETGGAEALIWEEVAPPPAAAAGQVQIRHHAVGLNFIDIYQRTSLYPLPELPTALGLEGAGEVVALGAGVDDLAVGAYCERRNLPADRLVHLPDGIGDRAAAAMMLKGLTAEYLLRRAYPVAAGDTIFVHAAAGGVGLIVCQWAAALGARVIGTVGNAAKARLAAAHGCHHPVVVPDRDFVAEVERISGGNGLPVVYDSVGKDTFAGSLACLKPRGTLVSFGQSSGPAPPLDITELSRRGSLYLTRPTLFTYTERRDELVAAAEAFFEVVLSGKVRVEIGQTFPLRDVAEAHRALESRGTSGSTVLIP